MESEVKLDIAKKRLTRRERQALSDEWEKSGLNQIDFCQQKGINTTTLTYWRTQLKKEKDSKDDAHFLPVKLKSSGQRPDAHDLILKLPNGISLEISATVDKTLLKSVVELLGI